MNEAALRGWFWAAVIVLALAIWVIWAGVAGIISMDGRDLSQLGPGL